MWSPVADANNGFEDMATILGKMDIGQDIADEGLKQGAETFTEWLRPEVPRGNGGWNAARYGHMRDQLKVVKTPEGYDVTFGDAFWWIFVENGTGGKHPQRAQNFVHGMFSQKWNELESMLQAAAVKKIEK